MRKIDWYIIKKFLGTFLFSITLILLVVIVFDISEKIDDFIEKEAPLRAIIFEYYLNFIPYFGNLFSPLFTFIAVIFFTSKMANNTEIISILSSGVSFQRMMLPFIISAIIIGSLSFTLGNFIIPSANEDRLEFENTYIKNPYRNRDKNIHIQISPVNFVYMESYNSTKNIGYKFSMEMFLQGELKQKLFSNYVEWDSTSGKWNIHHYFINTVETMSYFKLNNYIAEERMKGSKNLVFHLIEKHKRIAFPFATIILTLIAVAFASSKVRGGIGLHLGVGLLISFSYILFMQISTTFATNGDLSPALAVWIPNLIYTGLAAYLLKKAPK